MQKKVAAYLTNSRWLLAILAAWSALVYIIAIFAHLNIPTALYSDYTWSTKFHGATRYLTPLVRFDAAHYISIAGQGYAEPALRAFFPLWPLLLYIGSVPIRLVAGGQAAIITTAVLLPGILSIAAFFVTRKWLLDEGYDLEGTRLSLILMVTFPFSFFYLAPYTESLFLLLIAAAFLTARRGQWWASALIIALATATRLPALALIPMVGIEYLDQHRWRLSSLLRAPWLLITPLGAITYLLYLQVHTGSWKSYFSAYRLGGPERHLNFDILGPFWRVAQHLARSHSISLNDALSVLVVAIAVWLLIKGWTELRPAFRIFCIISMLLPLITTTLDSTPRYYMLLVPLYPVAARLLIKRPSVTWLVLYINGLVTALLIALFTNGFFIG